MRARDYESTTVEAARRFERYEERDGGDPEDGPTAEDYALMERERQRQRRIQEAE